MNRWFKPKSFMDLIENYNPFAFKKEDGDTEIFRTYKDVYLYTLKKLYLMFPRGYCDMCLFVHVRTQLPFTDSCQVVKSFKSMGVEDVELIDFRTQDLGRKVHLERVMKALHTISETKFNDAMFMEALIDFDVWLETVDNKELLEFCK